MPVQHKSTHKNAVRSRQMIKKAFAEMLNEKDISKITVTDIVEKAGISRGTFYAHYMDVYDLYNAIQSNMMEAVKETIEQIGPKQILLDPTEVLSQAFRFLDEKKFYYKLFITSSRSDALVKRIIAYIGDTMSSTIDGSFSEAERKEINLFLYYSLGAMENSDLPVLVTLVYDGSGKLLTGGTVVSTTAMLEGLGVTALGVNCGLGPDQMLPLAQDLMKYSSLPVIVNPNAGLPRSENGVTVYDVGPEEFAASMQKIAECGVHVLGGCCGTTPAHIEAMIRTCREIPITPPTKKEDTFVTSFSQAVEIGKKPVMIGERINPTGKKRFQQALRDADIDYILTQAIEQEDSGAQILDVNVGLPGINEPEMMKSVVTRIQGITGLPLQIDASDPAALEAGLRYYNGKPMVNSVSGKKESIEAVMPLVKKYGGVLVGLALDEEGIPDTAEGRLRVADRIYEAADRYGIPRKDVVIDGLAMTVSSDSRSALTTLETIGRIHRERNGHTILGVSNISFGLPRREIVNSTFLAMALQETTRR